MINIYDILRGADDFVWIDKFNIAYFWQENNGHYVTGFILVCQ